jgi:hypothetical protein
MLPTESPVLSTLENRSIFRPMLLCPTLLYPTLRPVLPVLAELLPVLEDCNPTPCMLPLKLVPLTVDAESKSVEPGSLPPGVYM